MTTMHKNRLFLHQISAISTDSDEARGQRIDDYMDRVVRQRYRSKNFVRQDQRSAVVQEFKRSEKTVGSPILRTIETRTSFSEESDDELYKVEASPCMIFEGDLLDYLRKVDEQVN
jgi:hypothetical protein